MLSIKEVRKNIFLLDFKSSYDAPMYFLRYQEYYESPKVKGKMLTMVNLMEQYVNDNKKGSFTYPDDWIGFNLPSNIIFEVHERGIEDVNRYDRFMLSLAEAFKAKVEGEDFYIIGTSKTYKEALDHEIAHGLFYTNRKYRKKMQRLIKKLPKKTREFIFKRLAKDQYHESVHVDEAQAYLATGLRKEMKKKVSKKQRKPFKKVLKKYSKKTKI